MRLGAFFLLTFAGFLPAYSIAQEIVCDGSVTSYLKEFAPLAANNIVFMAERDALILQSVLPEFPEEFRNAKFSMSRAQGLVTLTYPENRLFTGGINRHTGEILLLLRTEDPAGLLRNAFAGICGHRSLDNTPFDSK